jgi:hypothetical protein
MHDFILVATAIGFGALSWLLLMLRDWMFGDRQTSGKHVQAKHQLERVEK